MPPTPCGGLEARGGSLGLPESGRGAASAQLNAESGFGARRSRITVSSRSTSREPSAQQALRATVSRARVSYSALQVTVSASWLALMPLPRCGHQDRPAERSPGYLRWRDTRSPSPAPRSAWCWAARAVRGQVTTQRPCGSLVAIAHWPHC